MSSKIPPDLEGSELDNVGGVKVGITAFGDVLRQIFSEI